MSKNNTLISGDNKGIAALLFERQENSKNKKSKFSFVAGFANSNEGDVSPVPNRWQGNEYPDLKDSDLAYLVGEKQFLKSKKLFEGAQEELEDNIDYRHIWVSMPSYIVKFGNNSGTPLCYPALGYSMFAGAEDGRGEFPGIHEGMKQNESWDLTIKDIVAEFGVQNLLLKKPSYTANNCHYPKPVLADFSGEGEAFSPSIMPFQIFRIGSVIILGAPSELTTVAGRRIVQAVEKIVKPAGIEHVVLAGLANDYSGYVTTFEEYQSQQYEGASTYYGPYTQAAYQQIFQELARSMVGLDDSPISQAILAKIETDASKKTAIEGKVIPWVTFQFPIESWFSRATLFGTRNFGNLIRNTKMNYEPSEVVEWEILSPNPNYIPIGFENYVEIQRYDMDQKNWKKVVESQDPELVVDWNSSFLWTTNSTKKVYWRIPVSIQNGLYKIVTTEFIASVWDKNPTQKTVESDPFFIKTEER